MQTFILVFFTVLGTAVGAYQFRLFPVDENAPRWKLVIPMLLHLGIGAGLGLFMGGWLAGQMVQLF